VGADARLRILAAAERLRYIPHEGARSLITRRTDTIGMILPDLHGEYFSELLRGADAAAREHGLHLLVSTSHGSAVEASAAIRSMRGRVDALLIMSPHLDGPSITESLPPSLPTVLLNAHGSEERPCVDVQDYEGAEMMVRHLASRGRNRIAHISGPAGNRDAQERLRGYLNSRPLALDEQYIVPGDFTAASGYRAGLALGALQPLPDAIFAANDVMAAGCIEALNSLKIPVPEQVAVGGFDDVPLARFLRPALTTMRVRVADLGRKALERVVDLMANPHAEAGVARVLPELIVRESCGHTGRTSSLDNRLVETEPGLGRYVQCQS
jgi:LacI family transcriptional regulator